LYTIGELANKVGISVRALRYYHKIGALEPTDRTKAGYRLYTHEDLEKLKKIKLLRDLGFKLKEIKDYLEGHEKKLQDLIISKMKEVEEEIESNRKLYERLKTVKIHLEKQPEPFKKIDHIMDYHFDDNRSSTEKDKYNVLLVDDVQMETMIWERALELDSINYITTYSAKKALELLQEIDIHFIATDYIMPEMDGLEFIKEIKNREEFMHIPVVIISEDDEVRKKVSDDEVVGVFSKPFNPARIKELIHQYVLDE